MANLKKQITIVFKNILAYIELITSQKSELVDKLYYT